MLKQPTVERRREIALALPDRTAVSGGATGRIEEWAGPLGQHAPSPEMRAFVDQLRVTAQDNQCCMFIARDPKGQAEYAARPNESPPPVALVSRFNDSGSLRQFLATETGGGGARNTAANANRPIIFLGHSESHVEALVLGLRGPQAEPGNLSRLAKWLGVKQREAANDNVVLNLRDLAEREGNITLHTKELTAAHYKAISGKADWNTAPVRGLQGEELNRVLRDVGQWNTGGDSPSAIMVAARPADDPGALELAVVARFDPGQDAVGAAHLVRIGEESRRAAAGRQATIMEYAISLKNELSRLKDVRLRQLLFFYREGKTSIQLSQTPFAEPRRPS
jgi:hypothetical protein